MVFSFFSRVGQGIRSLCQAVKHLLSRWTKPDNDAPVLNTALVCWPKTSSIQQGAVCRGHWLWDAPSQQTAGPFGSATHCVVLSRTAWYNVIGGERYSQPDHKSALPSRAQPV